MRGNADLVDDLCNLRFNIIFVAAFDPISLFFCSYYGTCMLCERIGIKGLQKNNNRAAANVRNIFSKTGGNLGATGSVAYMFNRKGVIEYDAEAVNEDEIMDAGLEAGAEDIVNEDGVITVTTDPADFEKVLEALNGKGYESVSAEISMVPDTYAALDMDTAAKVQKLIDRLEEDDDVQNVYTNADFPEGFEG